MARRRYRYRVSESTVVSPKAVVSGARLAMRVHSWPSEQRQRAKAVSLLLASVQARFTRVAPAAPAVSPLGAAGGCGRAAALASLLQLEAPPWLLAHIR